MNPSRIIAGITILILSALWFCLLSLTGTVSKGKRGDVPHCQEECLSSHTGKMKEFSEEYRKTQDWMAYQNGVEKEADNYSTCLTNCREVLPLK